MRRYLPDVLIAALLFLLPLLMFWPQTVGGKTLIPTENLYRFEPFATYREQVDAPQIAHNELVSDLILQNYQWKSFIRQSISQREIPLWNPRQFSGIPFMAAGQQSILYPPAILYYVLPLPTAYGWFTVVSLWLAGLFMFAFLRGLGLARIGGTIAGITYQLCGFLVFSAVHPMIIGAAVWLPLILLMVEFIIRQQPLFGRPSSAPWVVIGAGAIACNIFAGHPELTIYTLLIAGYYAAMRLVWAIITPPPDPLPKGANQFAMERGSERSHGQEEAPLPHALGKANPWKRGIKPAFWLLAMVALGIGLAAVQFIPLVEFANSNWRAERGSLETVLGYAHPFRDAIMYLLPNIFGGPTFQGYTDIFSGETITALDAIGRESIDWGMKNAVEGALYVGILPLALAAYALLDGLRRWRNANPSPQSGKQGSAPTQDSAMTKSTEGQMSSPIPDSAPSPLSGRVGVGSPPYRLIFLLLVIISATFMFGTKTYAIIYYAVPGVNQLNTAFRWVYGVTVGLAVLAGFGADALARLTPPPNPLPAGGEGEAASAKMAERVNPPAGEGSTEEDANHRSSGPAVVSWSRIFQRRVGLSSPVNGGGGSTTWRRRGSLAGRFGILLVLAGIAVLAGLLLTRTSYDTFASLFDRVVNNAAKAGDAFSDGRMFYSFAFPQILTFGVITLLAGVVFLLAARGWAWRGVRLWSIAAVVLVAADLLLASRGFNPASDPALLDFTPPSIQWLQDQQAEKGPFRYITLDAPGQHLPLFQANTTMRYGLDDVRGYESIIPAQYVAYMRQIQTQPQLDFNRVAPLFLDRIDEIDWSRLSLLNVRYVITHRSVDLPEAMTTSADPNRFPAQFGLAYEDEAVKIWETTPVPRAFVADTLNNETLSFDNPFAIGGTATIWRDTGREKMLDLQLMGERPQCLIISENMAPGWRAFVRPHGAGDEYEKPLEVERVMETLQSVRMNPPELRDLFEKTRDELTEEQQTNIDNGVYTVRMVYSPTSFQVGLFASVISAALLMFVGGVWLWRLLVGADSDEATAVSRVARNSIAPIILNLFNRGIDFAFAFVMLRVLGPEDAGIYYYAIIVFVWFDIFTNFGLDVFLIREASRDRARAGVVFFNTSTLRMLLVVACVPLLAGFILIRQATVEPALSNEALLAIGLLYIGLAPGSISKGLTSLFYAFEKAEYPAAVTTITTINKAVFGLIALLLGYGIVGLAAVSIGVNMVTLVILLWSARGMLMLTPPPGPLPVDGEGGIASEKMGERASPSTDESGTIPPGSFPVDAAVSEEGEAAHTSVESGEIGDGQPSTPIADKSPSPPAGQGDLGGGVSLRPNPGMLHRMVGESWPLMLNHFLATVFFQIDIVLLEAIRGARIVGQYSVAYRWLLALNIVPAFFTQALLPVMSRQANEDRAALKRTYTLGVKLLVAMAVPLAVIFTFLARGLVLFLGGAEYMPAGAIALQIMIWSIPIGWINSLTQYALIAVDLQRSITRAFFVAVSFNIITNLIFIPQYGYQAAAVTTIFSEAVLLLPFGMLLSGALGKLAWVDMIWRPALAGGVMFAVTFGLWDISAPLGLVVGCVVYPAALLMLRPLNAEERNMLRPLLPGRVRALVGV